MKPPREMTMGAGIFCAVCGARPFPELGPPETREDFEWLRTEIAGLGGTATVMATDVVSSPDTDELVEQFREQRHREYKDLIRDIEKLVKRWRGGKRPAPRPVARREAQAALVQFTSPSPSARSVRENSRTAATG